MTSQANGSEYAELSLTLDHLAELAPTIDAAILEALWPEVEHRVLARVAFDELEWNAQGGVAERVRNLAWEIGVSVDLHAVHLGALRTLAKLLRERGQLLAKRGAARGSIDRDRVSSTSNAR